MESIICVFILAVSLRSLAACFHC